MTKRPNPFRLKIAIGAMVALVSFFAVADYLPHTDDGCAVETHCLACRAHVGAVTDLAFASLPVGPNEVVRIEKTAHSGPLDALVRILPPGRAPPVSA